MDQLLLFAPFQCRDGGHDELIDLLDEDSGFEPALRTVGIVNEFDSCSQCIQSRGRLIEEFAHIGGLGVVPAQAKDVVQPAGDLAGVGGLQGVVAYLATQRLDIVVNSTRLQALDDRGEAGSCSVSR